jgi:hypothetical protein
MNHEMKEAVIVNCLRDRCVVERPTRMNRAELEGIQGKCSIRCVARMRCTKTASRIQDLPFYVEFEVLTAVIITSTVFWL